MLLQPTLILIDSGHFQYNSVMLGLTLLSLDFLMVSSDLSAAVFFVLSLGFKQMALYYAPAIGSYLLGKCIFLGPNYGYTSLLSCLAFCPHGVSLAAAFSSGWPLHQQSLLF